MTEFLVQRLIRDAQNTEDPSVREAYGRLAGIVGVICNVLLFVGKFLLGTLTGSVAITADAVNNLSDASSSIVTRFVSPGASMTFWKPFSSFFARR